MEEYSARNPSFYVGSAFMMDSYSSPLNMAIRAFIFVLILCLFTAVLLSTALSWQSINLQGKSNNSELISSTAAVGLRFSKEVSFFLEPVDFRSHDNEYSENEFSLSFNYPKMGLHGSLNKETEAEALATLHAAAQCKAEGKINKAVRLYEHAMALQPKHPDVLIEYGLFIEKVNRDIVAASTMYTRALNYYPDHDQAKKHRSRTQPLVEEIDAQMLGNLDRLREYFMRIPRGSSALRRLMREAYVEQVYHTVALEGNTMTLAQTRSILETHVAVGGKSVVEHNEILGMDLALRYLNHSLIHRLGSISVEDILNIHQRVLGFVDPFEAGHFRRTQVYVGGFIPSPPDQVENEMEDFIEWLNSADTLRIHPVELAALAHYKFVIIHPFVDGNGRTARLLMNMILMQAGFPPVVIPVEDRLRYYETLKLANEGDLRPFIRLIASCTEKTLDNYLRFTTEISQPFGGVISEINDSGLDEKIITPIILR